MEIETKYATGDNLFFLEGNKVICKKIREISIKINSEIPNITVTYGYRQLCDGMMGSNPMCYVNEKDAFFTKEELLRSL